MEYIDIRVTRFVGKKVVDDEDKVSEKEQALYQSGMGTLLYLTKHFRPDISNPVRELNYLKVWMEHPKCNLEN